LFAACSKRERSNPDAEEWQNIQALADDAVVESSEESVDTNQISQTQSLAEVPLGEFNAFVRRLEQMKAVERGAGQTLLTGESLVFDHGKRYVRMDENVVVIDDQGTLETESLIGQFSSSNTLESVEAKNGVVIRSENREAAADQGVYNYQNGFVRLEGHAKVLEGKNRLSGERIEFWIKGNRRMVCEPNALLVFSGVSGLELGETSDKEAGDTEIRADRAVYDESNGRAELFGNVRIRDSRGAMNCETVRLYLKDDNEIDWIEALTEVIIQSDDRKALADKATYHADDGKFMLEGDPKIKQGPNIMTGDRIIFWHETKRMVCEPNARALLYLDAETKAKFLKDLND
jgi:lipopolysaccharide export system protein LptA